MEQIKNEQLTVEISSLGAELQSIKDAQGNEYLWDGDEQYWNRHSPILFPIVCGLWKDTYRIDGKEYQLGRHGFARDTEFQLISKSEDRITYALTDSEATLKDYPYHFNLAITYRLEGKKLHVIWHVANTDDKQIFFQIGGHPAFLVPGAEKGKELKGQLKFDNPEPERLYGNVGGCVVEGYHKVPTENGVWAFTEDSFADDAVIFDRSQLKKITLLDEAGQPHISLGQVVLPAFGSEPVPPQTEQGTCLLKRISFSLMPLNASSSEISISNWRSFPR